MYSYRQALVAGRPFSGGHILEKGPPRDRPRRCSKSFILWQNLTWQNPASISRIQVCLTSGPSLPGCPRCREALVAGRPSLPGGPHCREALVAGRPSLPGGPRRLVGATSWKRVPPKIGQECAPNPLSYDKI